MFAKVCNWIELKRKKASFGRNLKIHGRVRLHGHGKFSIGDNCIITSSSHFNPADGSSETHFSTKEKGLLFIGNNVGISNSAITASTCVQIDDNVLIGSGCMISDTDHHEIRLQDRINHVENIACAPVHICSGVFVGARCIILKGVTIGKNSVIGAGSVVAKSVPENQIWAGNPAVFIKCIEQEEIK